MKSKYKNIVFADDDFDDVTLLVEAFEKKCTDVNFTIAGDGIVLLDTLKTVPAPDFIILDINIPFINGKECLKRIRSEHAIKEVPVMMYSTSNNKTDIEESFLNGANYYVVKPNSVAALD